MSHARREFIKQLAVALASLVMTRCVPGKESGGTPEVASDSGGTTLRPEAPTLPPPTISKVVTKEVTVETCYKQITVWVVKAIPDKQLTQQADILRATRSSGTLTPEATRQALAAIARERLRGIWLRLDELAEQAKADTAKGAQMRDSLMGDHRMALAELVARGELSEDVAGQVQVAFEAAADHIWRSNAPITPSVPALIDYKLESSDQLVKQVRLLAKGDGLDEKAVAEVEAVIAKDIAFLNLSAAEVDALYQRVLSGRQSGQPLPSFDDVDLYVGLEELEAAQFLVELLRDSQR